MPDDQMLIINFKKPNRNIGIMYLGKILWGEMKEIPLQFREIHVYLKMRLSVQPLDGRKRP